jgi:hypothetical protein
VAMNLDNGKSRNGTKPNPKPTQQTGQPNQQAEPQPLALPNQSLVMFQQLKTATQADMVAIDRMFDKRREVVANHYDRRAAEFGTEMAAQFGVEVDADFFDQGLTLDSALAEFDLLLNPATEEEAPIDEPEPSAAEQTIDTFALSS